MAKPSTALLEGAFFALSHLRHQRKSRQMKIWDDCSLIDIDASFSEPGTKKFLCKERALHHGNLGGIR